MWSAPLVSPRGDARPEEAILAQLRCPEARSTQERLGHAHRLLGRHLATTDLAQWENRAIDWADDLDLETLPEGTRRVVIGDSDRSTWRPSTSDERINLALEAICRRFSRHEPTPASGMVIRTGQARDRAPDSAHRETTSEVVIARVPESGVSEGARAEVQTRHGAITVSVSHDDALRPGVIDLPFIEDSATSPWMRTR